MTFKSIFGRLLLLNLFKLFCFQIPVIENCLGVFSDTFKNVNDDSKLLPVNNDPSRRKKEKCCVFYNWIFLLLEIMYRVSESRNVFRNQNQQ